jgi:hypothetical protein
MKFDDYGLVVRELESDETQKGFDGNRGDSCAETFRWAHLVDYLGNRQNLSAPYRAISTEKGYLRHPTTPWREDKFSFDQWVPLYLAVHGRIWQQDCQKYIDSNWWRTGNNNFVSPLYFTARRRAAKKANSLSDLPLLGMAIILRFSPIRWSDSKKWFESTKNASGDYLNFLHLLIQCETHGHTVVSKLAKWLTKKSTAMEKVIHYFLGEPDAFVVPLYEKALDKMYG